MQTKLYTFILNFRGGTYISQFRGETPRAALRNWISNVDTKGIKGLKNKHRAEMHAHVDEFGLVALNEVFNVWCHTFLLKDKLALLNVVLTGEE